LKNWQRTKVRWIEADGMELGLETLKAVILEFADSSLEQVMSRLRATALKRGKQTDDQTVLLVRRNNGAFS
jgi:hypothetical protein